MMACNTTLQRRPNMKVACERFCKCITIFLTKSYFSFNFHRVPWSATRKPSRVYWKYSKWSPNEDHFTPEFPLQPSKHLYQHSASAVANSASPLHKQTKWNGYDWLSLAMEYAVSARWCNWLGSLASWADPSSGLQFSKLVTMGPIAIVKIVTSGPIEHNVDVFE